MLILQGPEHPVEALAFSPDNTTLYATQGHHGVLVWKVTDRTTARLEFGGRLLVDRLLIHPDGRWAFGFTAHTVPPDYDYSFLIDLSNGTMQPLNFTRWQKSSVALFPGRSRVITVGEPRRLAAQRVQYSGLLLGWKLTSTGVIEEWRREIPINVGVLGIIPLGERFASVDVDWPPPNHRTAPTRISICNADTGRPETRLVYTQANFDQFLASPCGNWFVARYGNELHIWDANDWNRPPVIVPGKTNQRLQPSAAFHPSGQYLLLADNNFSIIAFDTSNWKEARKWNWKAGKLHTVAVSPDGTLAAAGGPRGVVVVWDWEL